MKARVTLIRLNGRRRKNYEDGEYTYDGFVISEVVRNGDYQYQVVTMRSGLPSDEYTKLPADLYEPTFEALGASAIFLRGYEVRNGTAFVQEWQVEPDVTVIRTWAPTGVISESRRSRVGNDGEKAGDAS